MNAPRLVLAMLLAAMLPPAAGLAQQATPVGVDAVQQGPMAQTVPVLGRLVPRQAGVVAARSQGPVAELGVQVGDRVQAGDTLAVLDRARLEAARDLAAAQLAELEARKGMAEADARLARRELRRLERLRGSAAFTESLYDQRAQDLAAARSAVAEAEARIAGGRVRLRLAEIELRDATIVAPYPGTVTMRHASEGDWLAVGDEVVTLVNDRDLEIEADVPAERLAGLVGGSTIEVVLEQGIARRAMVRAVVPDENPAARTRPVRLTPRFGELPFRLAVNQPVTLRIPAGESPRVVSVHKDAVLQQGGRSMVYVVEDGLAQPRSVELGEAVGSRFQVLDGLAPGDLAVIRGNERLRPGQPVRVPGAAGHAASGRG